ncbi:MAG TPA: Type 1 glutamine amidotransferase-like domain-containing protein [Pyrinomonadaceae bacterium]
MNLLEPDTVISQSSLKPIYLCADSQLLFWKENDALFLNSLRNFIDGSSPKAAYLGASNDHNPDFYELFQAAMGNIGVHRCRMIHSGSSLEDAAFLSEADIILLAGGEIEKGWREFSSNGLKELILKRYDEGALLVGTSAGAVQLGLYGWAGSEPADDLFSVFQLAPFVVSVHEEEPDWPRLRKAIRLAGHGVSGIGIAAGGGLIYHPNRTVEPIRFPLCELTMNGEQFTQSMLCPITESPQEAPQVC